MSSVHSPAPNRFVDDLIPIILDSNDHWWPKDLLRLACVSVEWLIHIRRQLYSCPTILSFNSCSLLARSLMENPSLRNLVNGIDLRPTVSGNFQHRKVSNKDRSGLRFILGLEGLRYIRLGGQLAVKAEQFLSMMVDTTAVAEMHIDGSLIADCLSSPASLEWDEGMTFRFSHMQKLKLTHIELDIIPPDTQTPLSVAELVLENVHITSGYLSYLFPDSHSDSLECLRVLSKSAPESDEHIRLLLDSCTIKSLDFEVQDEFPSQTSIFHADSPEKPSLRCIHLYGLHVDMDMLLAIHRRCPKLEHLVVSRRKASVCAEDWVSLLQAGRFPSLQRLAVCSGTNYPRWTPTAMDMLGQVCASRKIQLQSS